MWAVWDSRKGAYWNQAGMPTGNPKCYTNRMPWFHMIGKEVYQSCVVMPVEYTSEGELVVVEDKYEEAKKE
jgi:hypothetical protein